MGWDQLGVAEQEARLQGLAQSALPAWGLSGQLTLIKQRENAVFELRTDGGERFALRVHRAGYHSDAALESEMQWIDALREFGLSVPRVQCGLDGRRLIHARAPDVPGERQLDLIAWCEGRQLASIEKALPSDEDQLKHIFGTIGSRMAAMHEHAVGWTLPGDFERHAWDLDGLVGEQPFWGQFWILAALSDDQRALIQRARAHVAQYLTMVGRDPSLYSLIHADMVPENILIDGATAHIIDFDDAGFGWHLFDIATALYFIRDDPNFAAAYRALIEGYRSRRPLGDDLLADLPYFTAARGFTYLGWVHTRQTTETAQELTPMLVQMCCDACRQLEALVAKRTA